MIIAWSQLVGVVCLYISVTLINYNITTLSDSPEIKRSSFMCSYYVVKEVIHFGEVVSREYSDHDQPFRIYMMKLFISSTTK
jgi:hypothetical protein